MRCAIGAALAGATVLAGCSDQTQAADTATAPSAAQEIMAKPAYTTARWTYHVEDPATGEVLLSDRPDELVLTGSTAKQFTVGTVYDVVGPDTRLTTPVYATAPVVDGVVDGDLVLVASGDLALGGRGAMQGRMDHAFDATHIDHVYGDIAPNAARVDDDPLVGLDDLARQIAAKGVTTVDGDIVIDTRIWQTAEGHDEPVPPIYVNDNILDIDVAPGAVGQSATVATTPQTAAFTVASTVTTVAADQPTDLDVTPDPADPRRIVISGSVAADSPRLTIYRVPDAATWARTLFIEALTRAGITVTAPALGPNNESGLPAADTYPADRQLAALQSPPLKVLGTMILQTSYNTGANAMLCLLAAHADSTDCTDGLKTIRSLFDKAGMVSDDVVLADGEGDYPAATTPRQMVSWIKWAMAQSWGQDFADGQPVLGVSGTVAAVGADSPAKGKVAAKTGTIAAGDPSNGRVVFNVQSLAGFMTTDDGRRLVFDLSMSGGTYPDVLTGLTQSNADVGAVAAAFQQSLSGT